MSRRVQHQENRDRGLKFLAKHRPNGIWAKYLMEGPIEEDGMTLDLPKGLLKMEYKGITSRWKLILNRPEQLLNP